MSALNKRSDTHEERYAHIKIEGHPRIQRATVFARKCEGLWWVSVAFCSNKDQFDRSKGRNIARKRWFQEGADTQLEGHFTIGEEFTFEKAQDFVHTLISLRS